MLEARIGRGQLVRLHRGVYAVGHAHLRRGGHWLAEVLPHQALTKVCGEAERQRKLDTNGIEEALERRRGRRGPAAAKLRAALAELAVHGAQLTRSHLEDQFLSLLDAHDLSRPATNAYVEGYEGDAVWSSERLAVELDGWEFHRTRAAFQRDRDKANRWTAMGWTVLRFTHDDLARRPEAVVAAVRDELSRAA